MQFYEKYIKCCNEKGLSPSFVAQQIGLSKAAVTRWKAGNRPTGSNIMKLSEYFGTTIDFWSDNNTQQQNKKADESELVEIDSRLNAKGHDNLIRYARFLLSDNDMLKEPEEKKKTKIIPLLGNSFAAGYGEPDFGNPWENYEIDADSRAEFAIRITGDSMSPFLEDGSIALAVKQTPKDGEVGAFLLNGEFLVKQVCEDIVGNVYLFSLNRNRKDADRVISHDGYDNLMCFGTVLLKRIPLPGD